MYYNKTTEQNRASARLNRIGQQYGDFIVDDVIFKNDNKQRWVLHCTKCGEIKVIENGREFHADVRKGKNKARCGCDFRKAQEVYLLEQQEKAKMRLLKNLEKTKRETVKKQEIESNIGVKYWHLTCVEHLKSGYIFRCDCGRDFVSKLCTVKNGIKKTCGNAECEYHKLTASQSAMDHGCSVETSEYRPLYRVYRGMITRCYNQNNLSYVNYGARGIEVCEQWLNDFTSFKEWAVANGWKYEKQENGYNKWSIDRIDVNGNYEPSNCRWSTSKEQRVNQRPIEELQPRKSSVEINGVTKLKKEWCEEYGITCAAVLYRMKSMGMTFEQAVTLPKRQGDSVY